MKRWRKNTLAITCCAAMLGMSGCQADDSMKIASDAVMYDLPGYGVHIADAEEESEILAVQINEPVQEQNGVRAELQSFICVDSCVSGAISFTGENIGLMPDGSMVLSDDENRDGLLEEKFKVRWFDGETERTGVPRGVTVQTNDEGFVDLYKLKFENGFYLHEGVDEITLKINAFDAPFVLKMTEPKEIITPEDMGYAEVKNGSAITARAAVTDDGIEVEFFRLPSDEVQFANELWWEHRGYGVPGPYAPMPYMFDMDAGYLYTYGKDGEELDLMEPTVSLKNGGKRLLNGTEADFPLTFHHYALAGANEETHTLDMALPADGEKVTSGLPEVKFEYGTVEFISIERNGAGIDMIYRITPKDGLRQMYTVDIDVADRQRSSGLDTNIDDLFVRGLHVVLNDGAAENMTVTLKNPYYWILGEYDVVIEKPTQSR